MNNKRIRKYNMSKIKLNKGDLVELSGTEYEVTVVGKNQITLKNDEVLLVLLILL